MVSNIELEYLKLEGDNSWRDFFQEIKLTDEVSSCSHAKHSLNLKYNRYKDILPYDHSRVKLKDARETDYINANFVECKLAQKKYILAQGPLKNTNEHFWQMIWEQNTKGIVMLNRLFEKGISKCEMYYPNADEENSEFIIEYGRFRLNYLSELTFEDFAIRTLELENIEQKEKRKVYHCHYTNWPDFGEPEYTTSFLNFLNECNKFDIFNASLYGPSVVHCSAGVGRSGTFILVDTYISLYKTYGEDLELNIRDILSELRTYRMGLVQTHQQLRFAYASIIDAIKKIQFENETATASSSNGLSSNFANRKTSLNKKLSCSSFSSSDEEQEDDDDEKLNGDQSKSKLTRPSTGKYDRKKLKQMKPSKDSENHVKNLRELQFKNKLLNNNNDYDNDTHIHKSEENTNPSDINLILKTAVNRTSLEESKSLLKDDLKLDLKLDSDDNDEEIDDEIFNSDESDEKPFANSRNISTVKVNQPRKPLEKTINVSQNDNLSKISQIKENENINEENDLGLRERAKSPSKIMSDREKRVSELVNSIKQKQKQHEQKKQFFADFKPYLIGSGLIIGGAILLQIYRSFFSRSI